MIYAIVLFYLFASLLLYCLLGGADFGAGIIEVFSGEKKTDRVRHIINRAMAPVWEANHVWLIVVIVILFMGFPLIFSRVSIYFHIPLTLMLTGIIFRGCAFAFRYYDPFNDKSHQVYNRIFAFSSLVTPMFFGIMIGALSSSHFPEFYDDFYESFFAPWLGWVPFFSGFFIASLFAYLAAVYLTGEAEGSVEKSYFVKQAQGYAAASVITGFLVLLFSQWAQVRFWYLFISNPVCFTCIIAATALMVILWKRLSYMSVFMSRAIIGGQIFLIIFAWVNAMYPAVIFFNNGRSLTLLQASAPQTTLNNLSGALLCGSLIIFPGVFFLLRVFKWPREEQT